MADTKISALAAVAPADADYVPGVDVSDTSQSAGGTTRRFLFSAIWTYISGKIGTLGALAAKSTVATADVSANAITFAKLQQAATGDSIIAKTAQGAGDFVELAAPTNTVLRRVGGVLGWGLLSKVHLNANIVDNTILTQVATAILKGRKTAGTGNVEDLTMADLVSLLDTYFGSTDWRSTGTGSSITVGAGIPATAPANPGLFYIDTNNYDLYFSTGSATAADWKKSIDDGDGASIGSKATPVLADTVFQFDSANGDVPVIATWTQIIAALKLVTLDASGRLVNPKAIYTSYDGGTPAAASTYTPAAADGNLQHLLNNAAFTLAVPANPGSIVIEIVNGATAGAITTTGYTKVSGDPLTTTNGHKFIARITKTNSVSDLNIQAMQ